MSKFIKESTNVRLSITRVASHIESKREEGKKRTRVSKTLKQFSIISSFISDRTYIDFKNLIEPTSLIYHKVLL